MEIKSKTARAENYGGARGEIAYIVIHYTANRGDTAKNNADYFAREVVKASAHYFVDENEVWQSVPDGKTAWHCGAKTYRHAKCRNANSIGIEICMQDKAGKLRQASIDRAAALTRALMDKYGVPAANVIRHYDVTGKNCPAPMVADPALWQKFKQSLEVKTVSNDNTPSAWAKAAWDKVKAAEIMDGTRPRDNITREEVALILCNLKLVK